MTTVISVSLEEFKCWVCGCNFAVESTIADNKRRYGKSMYCPNGCQLGFGETPEQKLRKEMEEKLAVAKRQKEYLEASLSTTRNKLDETERRRRAEKGAKTRLKNRINAGTCPCCDQSFADLAEHIQSQHPEFVATVEHDEPAE